MPLWDAVTTDTHRVTVIIVNFNGGDVILQCLTARSASSTATFRRWSSTTTVQTRLCRLSSGFPGCDSGARKPTAASPVASTMHSGNARCGSLAPSESGCISRTGLAGQPGCVPRPTPTSTAAFGSRMFSDEATVRALDGVGDVYHQRVSPWRRGMDNQFDSLATAART